MILEALNTVVGLINDYISPQHTDAPLILGNISRVNDGDEFSAGMQDKLVLSVINIQEDRVARSPEHFMKEDQLIKYKNPAIHLNITLMFAATHDYRQAIPLLERIISFFQAKYVFTPGNTPELEAVNAVNNINIEKLIFEWVNLDMERVNQLWTTLGGHYMPSIVFRMRMITIDELKIKLEALPIKAINTEVGHS